MAQTSVQQPVDKKPKKKAPWTMVMQIANAHAFSIGFVGIQLTHGYVAALGLSSICVIVGMIVSLQPRFAATLWVAYAAGIPLGAVIAFVFDGMTLFGLKMVHESKGIKKGFAFLLCALGIGMSTMAGDQMWGLIYNDWHSFVFAASVSCVIVMVDVWHKEHEAAVQKATENSDAVQEALSSEVETVVDHMLREHTHQVLQSPQMQEDLRKQSEENVRRIVQAKFNKRLARFASQDGAVLSIEEVEQPAQLPEQAESKAGEASKTDEQMDEMERVEQQPEAQASKTDEQPGGQVSMTDEQLEVIAPAASQPEAQASEIDERPDEIDEQPEPKVVVYGDYREELMEGIEQGSEPTVTELMRRTGRPRSTCGRWLAKARREVEALKAARLEEEVEDGTDEPISDMLEVGDGTDEPISDALEGLELEDDQWSETSETAQDTDALEAVSSELAPAYEEEQ